MLEISDSYGNRAPAPTLEPSKAVEDVNPEEIALSDDDECGCCGNPEELNIEDKNPEELNIDLDENPEELNIDDVVENPEELNIDL